LEEQRFYLEKGRFQLAERPFELAELLFLFAKRRASLDERRFRENDGHDAHRT
jgi:hypothetical protein